MADGLFRRNGINYLSVRGLYKAVFINAGVAGQVQNQANVGTFWGFYRANTTIMGGVGVTHLKTSALA